MLTDEHITEAAALLREGGLVAFPTETVYGLGANALDASAVVRVFEVKQRPRFDPLIVHLSDPNRLEDVVEDVPPLAKKLVEKFWPGPLSLVLKKKVCVPDIVTAGLSSVAVRCPSHQTARRLIKSAGVPIAAPSANRFGAVSPTTAEHVREQFGGELPIILDDGPCQIGVESTVVSFVDSATGVPTMLRPGGVALEEIEAVIGDVNLHVVEETQPASPGQLLRHYSPTTPLHMAIDQSSAHEVGPNKTVGLLSLRRPSSDKGFAMVEVLSEQGCLREAAANLFAAMRRLDAAGLDVIVAYPVPEIGLGRAITDRLRRASARR